MDALVVHRPKEVSVAAWEDPVAGAGEAIVAVASCGVCGTDRHIADGTYPATYPNVLGHEISGTVIAVGPGVDRVREGDRVVVDPNIPDHECAACRRGDIHLCENLKAIGVTQPGGMAPKVAAPQSQLYRIAAGLSLEDAAFAEPLSCIVHGLERVKVQSGGTVAVLGAGSIGLLAAQAVREIGAASVVMAEPSAIRRELAEALGADEVYTPEMMEHDSHSEEYDLVLECSGNPEAVGTAIRLARRGADILLFGVAPRGAKVSVEPYELYRKELRLVASNINPFTMEKAVALLDAGTVKVKGIVSHAVSLEELPKLLLGRPPADLVKAALRFEQAKPEPR
ncbi:MAG TPA: zinc-dependent alcohol dehydrogenase family protein [Candidatus Acidoferrales bacterium]|nr:zinc-dependent alcohol dehydrogenase family protein [Candidatus Acidoferrales bacterium]